jgi:2-alkyl-3-oxoalkanoate reductase
LTQPTVLIIGASGFIGGWVTEALHAAGGTTLRAGVRGMARAGQLTELASVRLVRCDLLDRSSLEAALEGVDTVINCARDHDVSGGTVAGARLLTECAAAKGVGTLIQLSSVAVYGAATGLVTEDTPPVSPVNAYGLEKRAAEEVCRAAAGPKLRVVVLRPSLVYGPRGEEWTAAFLRDIFADRLRRLGPAGTGQANLVYAGDLARFIVQLTGAELSEFLLFNVNGAEIPTFDEYFNRLSFAVALGPLAYRRTTTHMVELRRQARRVARLAVRQATKASRGTHRFVPGLASFLDAAAEKVRYGFGDEPPDNYAKPVTYCIDRARAHGFRPETSLDEGIAASVAWARASGVAREDRSRAAR